MSLAFRSNDGSELLLERTKNCFMVSGEKWLPFHTVKRIPWRHCLSKAIRGLTYDTQQPFHKSQHPQLGHPREITGWKERFEIVCLLDMF